MYRESPAQMGRLSFCLPICAGMCESAVGIAGIAAVAGAARVAGIAAAAAAGRVGAAAVACAGDCALIAVAGAAAGIGRIAVGRVAGIAAAGIAAGVCNKARENHSRTGVTGITHDCASIKKMSRSVLLHDILCRMVSKGYEMIRLPEGAACSTPCTMGTSGSLTSCGRGSCSCFFIGSPHG